MHELTGTVPRGQIGRAGRCHIKVPEGKKKRRNLELIGAVSWTQQRRKERRERKRRQRRRRRVQLAGGYRRGEGHQDSVTLDSDYHNPATGAVHT